MIRTSFCLVALALAAAASGVQAQNKADGLITRLQPAGNSGGPVLIYTNADVSGLNCGFSNGPGAMTLMADQVNFNAIYATLLTGLIAQRPMVVRISEGSTDCRVSYVSIQ